MAVGLGTAQFVVMLQDVLDRFIHAVEVGHLVEHTVHAALGARPVVADDVEDQRIVQLPHVLDGLDQSADLRVGIFPESGEYLHLPGKELLLVCSQLVPVLDGFGLGCQLRVCRDYAQSLLAGQGLFAEFVPSLVELALVLGDPFLRHMVRRMGGAGSEVDEEWLVRRERFLVPHPVDGLIGHVGHEVVVRVF